MTTKRMRSSNRAKIEKALTRQAEHFESAKTQKIKGGAAALFSRSTPAKPIVFLFGGS